MFSNVINNLSKFYIINNLLYIYKANVQYIYVYWI